MTDNIKRENTPTEQNREDNVLVLYRLKLVEDAVRDVGAKMDRSDNIKRDDLLEFRDSIIARFGEIRDDLQKQINEKADSRDMVELRSLVKTVGVTILTILTGIITYYLTYGRR